MEESKAVNNSAEEKKWVEVILPLAAPKAYTYSVPATLQSEIKIGCRAEVVFGKNKKHAGIIKCFVPQPPFPTKDILSLIDQEPVIYQQQLDLWKWMSDYYMCREGEVMNAALPTHLKLSSESILVLNEEYGDDFSGLSDEEFIIAEALLIKKELRLSEVQQISNLLHVYPLVRKLTEKGVCFVYESLDDHYKPKKEKFVFIHPDVDNDTGLTELLDNMNRAPKQQELLLSFLHFRKTQGEVKQSELLKKSGATTAQLKALLDKHVLYVEEKTVDRLPQLGKTIDAAFTLSEAQQKAYGEMEEVLQKKNICLLHGVTGSGKTLLYMKQLEKVIRDNGQALYLLPEITLTTQIIRKLQKSFGGHIAIYHSKFSNRERVEIWDKVKKGTVNVVVGARSALFLPYKNLKLVIIDEEQDSSFKQQDPAPRYNARDTAIYYASLFNAKVILGSATPSVESFYNSKTGKFGLVALNERYGGASLPDIDIIDLKTVAQFRKGKVILSPQLLAAMEETLKNKKQIILFQNRRGYSPLMICGTCGYIPRCVHCDVSLTLHKSSNKLHCHYCGQVYSKLVQCPECDSTNWMERNFGTEKVEEELRNGFPEARIARMDVDSMRGKYAHDELIKLFEQHKIDILAGTQMVVKGLDFENVMLIGILDADGLLSFADFRVNERGFQLMEQVSGRAGRKEGTGKVYIQAARTNHPVLGWVKDHDYERFYENEIRERDQFYYPPFSRILKITLKHKRKELVEEAAIVLVRTLEKSFKNISGPAEPPVSRIRNQFLMDIILKLPPDNKKLIVQKAVIKNCIDLVKPDKRFSGITIIPDVDPY